MCLCLSVRLCISLFAVCLCLYVSVTLCHSPVSVIFLLMLETFNPHCMSVVLTAFICLLSLLLSLFSSLVSMFLYHCFLTRASIFATTDQILKTTIGLSYQESPFGFNTRVAKVACENQGQREAHNRGLNFFYWRSNGLSNPSLSGLLTYDSLVLAP